MAKSVALAADASRLASLLLSYILQYAPSSRLAIRAARPPSSTAFAIRGPFLIAGISLSACAGDYPLPPTACDEYCHLTRDLQCGLFYYPAQCVSQCERELKGDDACREQLNGVLSCFATNSAAERRCRAYDSYPPNLADAGLCEAALGELDICSSTLRIATEPAQPQPRL